MVCAKSGKATYTPRSLVVLPSTPGRDKSCDTRLKHADADGASQLQYMDSHASHHLVSSSKVMRLSMKLPTCCTTQPGALELSWLHQNQATAPIDNEGAEAVTLRPIPVKETISAYDGPKILK